MAFKAFDLYAKIGLDRKELDKDLDAVSKDLQKKTSKTGKVTTKLGLDDKEFNKGTSKAQKTLKAFETAVKKVGSAINKVGQAAWSATTTALKATSGALLAAAGGVVALAKKSYSAYSEYQQMVGGVQKLYGNMNMSLAEYAEAQGKSVAAVTDEYARNQRAQAELMKNAKQAFKTTGMSANQYMETATQFSAALISSLGGDTEAAAKQTDVAMRAISDNWNTFGGDLESIKHAFTGFAKQNYTMLDNLKLGYGGTKKEMERLIADANEWAKANGKAADLSIESFSDVVTAIDYIQQKQNIAKTTSREAATTIAGSFGSLKAAWENLVTGFADPDADLGQLLSDVTETASTALKNAIPTIVRTLGGIATAVKEVVPSIVKELPSLINEVLPSLLSAAGELISALSEVLPDIVEIIMDWLPDVVQQVVPVAISTLKQIITLISDELPVILTIIEENIDDIADGVFTVISAIASMVLKALPQIAEMVVKWLPKALEFIKSNLYSIKNAISTILKTLGQILLQLLPIILPIMVDIALDLIQELAKGFKENASDVIAGILAIVNLIIDTLLDPNVLMTLIEATLTIVVAIAEGLVQNMDTIVEAVLKIIGFVIVAIVGEIPNIINAALDLANAIGEGFLKASGTILSNLGSLLSDVLGIEGLGKWIVDIAGKAEAIASAIWDGIQKGWDTVWEFVKGFGSDIAGAIWDGLGDLFAFGVKIVETVIEGIKSVAYKIKDALDPTKTGHGATDIVSKYTNVGEKSGSAEGDGYVMGLEKALDINSPSRETERIGRMTKLGFVKGEDEVDDPFFDEISNINSIDMDAIQSKGVKSNGGGMFGAQTAQVNELVKLISGLLTQDQTTVIPVYIGGQQVDEILVTGKNRITTRSGGQVNV